MFWKIKEKKIIFSSNGVKDIEYIKLKEVIIMLIIIFQKKIIALQEKF